MVNYEEQFALRAPLCNTEMHSRVLSWIAVIGVKCKRGKAEQTALGFQH